MVIASFCIVFFFIFVIIIVNQLPLGDTELQFK